MLTILPWLCSKWSREALGPTYAVGARMLAIAFGSKLIALIAGARYPPSYGATGAC